MPKRSIDEIARDVLYNLSIDGKVEAATEADIKDAIIRTTKKWRSNHLKDMIRAFVALGYLTGPELGIYKLKRVGQVDPCKEAESK